ncbi:MAG: hypothetical protein ACPGD5_00405 [Salibacteraceae bacterium]
MPTVKINEKQYRFHHNEREPSGEKYETAMKLKEAVLSEDPEKFCEENGLDLEFVLKVRR